MNVAIICELNPFHKGHERIFKAARVLAGHQREDIPQELLRRNVLDGKALKALPRKRGRKKKDAVTGIVVAVMSGNFCERGEPALLDKWTRARIALECGADAVVEIPSVYSAASAQFFADAAVDIVEGLGCIDLLLFGSECGDGEVLSGAVQKRLEAFDNRGLFKVGAADGDGGESFPKAMEKHLGVRLSGNDILAVEYVCALTRRRSNIIPGFFQIASGGKSGSEDDAGEDVHAGIIREICGEIARAVPESAWESETMHSAILAFVEKAERFMPPAAWEIFREKLTSGDFVWGIEALENVILAELRRMKPVDADRLPFAGDGLGRKILELSLKSGSLARVISGATGKAYTAARVRRTMLSVVTGARQETYPSMIFVPYVRLLAVKKSVNISKLAAGVSAASKGVPAAPKGVSGGSADPYAADHCGGGRARDFIVGNIPADYEKSCSADTVRLLGNEIIASDLYALGCKVRKYCVARKEFTNGLISL